PYTTLFRSLGVRDANFQVGQVSLYRENLQLEKLTCRSGWRPGQPDANRGRDTPRGDRDDIAAEACGPRGLKPPQVVPYEGSGGHGVRPYAASLRRVCQRRNIQEPKASRNCGSSPRRWRTS